MLRYRLIISITLLNACTGNPGEPPSSITQCKDPRPQICTTIYDPVCGLTQSGLRKTYASACSACATADVAGFEKGGCPEAND